MAKKETNGLVRTLGLTALIIYGVGDILGAGIYALVGKIAGLAGPYTWLSFLIAMFIVFFTALTYSELVSRFPRSGGVSIFVQESFGHPSLSILAGLLLFSATLLSMSTLTQAFIGYLSSLGVKIPTFLGAFSFLLVLLLINIRGIRQSSIANIISTLVEVSGLLMVLIFGLSYLMNTDHSMARDHAGSLPNIGKLFEGAALAFFAFTGFEDLANVAEEVKQPKKNVPRAILSSLGIAGIMYLSVSWVATAIIPGQELSQSSGPLLDVVHRAYPPLPIFVFSLIALFAVFNTTLLNYITASRLLYGMAEEQLIPKFFQQVHKKFHTPYVSILFIFPIVLVLGTLGSLKGLASSTSAVVLILFSFSSIALINIKRKEPKKSALGIFRVPMWVPCLAVVLNVLAISFLPFNNLIPAMVFIVVGGIVVAGYQIAKASSH